jgi:hypothetical protein
VVLVVAIVAAVLGFSAWRLVVGGWQLTTDYAVVALRSSDVFTSHTPALGMPTSVPTWVTAPRSYHPGPTVFWVLAPFTSIFGVTRGAVLFGTWALCVASFALLCRLADVDRGTRSVVVIGGLVGINLLWFPLILQPLNPLMAVLPTVGMLFAARAILAGRSRYWPVLVLLASFVVQADLEFLALAASVVGACAIVTLSRARSRRRPAADLEAPARRPPPATPRSSQRRTASWVVGVTVVMWGLPIWQAITHRGGNVRALATSAADSTRQSVPVRGFGGAVDGMAGILQPFHIGPTDWNLLWPLGVAAILVLGWNRSKLDLARALPSVVVSLAATIGALVSQFVLPQAADNELYNVPTIVASVFVWYTLLLLLLELIQASGRLDRPNLTTSGTARIAIVVGVIGVSLIPPLGAMSYVAKRISFKNPGGVTQIADQLRHNLEAGAYAMVPLGDGGTSLAHGLAAALAGSNIRLRVSVTSNYLGPTRSVDGSESGTLLLTTSSEAPPLPEVTRVGSWRPDGAKLRTSEALDRQVADAVRRSASIVGGVSDYDVGASVYATGSIKTAVPLSRSELSRAGRMLRRDPAAVRRLPDGALALLYYRDLLSTRRQVSYEGADVNPEVARPTVWLVGGGDTADRPCWEIEQVSTGGAAPPIASC